MRRPPPLPPQLATAFSTDEARAAGVTRRRTRATDLVHPFYDVHAALPLETTLARAQAFRHVMHPHQFFSHLTAAELLGLRMPEGFQTMRLT
jgi:hypothetical protein